VLQSDVAVPAVRIRRELGFRPHHDLVTGVRSVLVADSETAAGRR
jgi:hypothetical protein